MPRQMLDLCLYPCASWFQAKANWGLASAARGTGKKIFVKSIVVYQIYSLTSVSYRRSSVSENTADNRGVILTKDNTYC